MSRLILFTLLSILLFFSFIILVPKVFAQGLYSVSGYVCDDRNANGHCDLGEPGIPGMMIYADNTYGQRAYTDAYGYWRIDNLPAGAHSIEIANAGSFGSRPTTAEKFTVNGSSATILFGVQSGGYDVEGYVRDEFGRPVSGATVYVDLPNRQTAITNATGYYRIENVGYDSSIPVYGYSGGHNIYVQGYDSNPILVNPQYATISMPGNFTVRSQEAGPGCGPAYARDSNTRVCAYFTNRCVLPSGWYEDPSCSQAIPPPGGTCSEGQVISTSQRCSGQYLCSYDTVRRADCTTYERQHSCYLSSQCGYSQYSGYTYSDSQPVQLTSDQTSYVDQSDYNSYYDSYEQYNYDPSYESFDYSSYYDSYYYPY